ncbi:MAG: UDP-N-acetylmuramate--L-alanine ligase [Candidatus Abyssobacteria bacterium SURF_5]|uniref:UDP-N-acetylmuramate--L-alanine ligase n=1 Tax=Abyssobacteria bacterium (strain SURF_5) TaxID=2093360 RepID=A0A3A4P305_ABYX5|nr:MAG: UDP-N-acetylmuramate--L-alanine ligase [Candidatus Abyssubacteria bacterium SURF_5]
MRWEEKKAVIRTVQKVHFVGIGGIGMSGLAEILLNLGYQVSGSDPQPSPITSRLEKLGAVFYDHHDADNIHGANIVVYSAAIPRDNPELLAAQKAKIPAIPRSEMLADLMRMKPNAIAVAGTHGKTTTTSMIAAILEKADIESTAIIGGILNRKGSNVSWGTGDYLVAEADEHDGSFLKLFPTITVVTSIDAEHLEYYGTIDAIRRAFLDFSNRIPFYGFSVVNKEDVNVRDILPQVRSNLITYAINYPADLEAVSIKTNPPSLQNGVYKLELMETSFDVKNSNANLGPIGVLGRVKVKAAGKHNVLNALAAISVGLGLGMPFQQVSDGLLLYDGVERRLQIKANFNGLLVVEDYAHHPTEISATLDAVSHLGGKRILAIFQPHLYSRTKFFTKEFAQSLLATSKLMITEIYKAREEPMPGVSGLNIVNEARKLGHPDAEFFEDKFAIPDAIEKIMQKGDVILVLGAGDIWKIADGIADRIKRKHRAPSGNSSRTKRPRTSRR